MSHIHARLQLSGVLRCTKDEDMRGLLLPEPCDPYGMSLMSLQPDGGSSYYES